MTIKNVVELPALTGLRGLLALWVLAFHVSYILLLLEFPLGDYFPRFVMHYLDIGGLGVDGFFLLSGFVLAHVYSQDLCGKLSVASVRKFLWLRLARVYPVHLTLILIYAVLKMAGVVFQVEDCGAPGHDVVYSCWRFDLPGLLSQLTLTATWGWYNPLTWNPPAWSISAEWAAYLAFPFLLQLTSRLRQGVASLLLAMMSVGFLGMYLSTRGFAWKDIPIDDVSLARIGFEFTAGMLMYRCYQSPLFGRIPWPLVAAMCPLIALALLLMDAPPLAFVLLFIPFILSLAQSQGIVPRFLASKGMMWLGAISYSLYMGHILVIDILGVVAGSGNDDKLGPLLAVGFVFLVLSASLVVGSILYYFVEEPCRRAMRRL